jgi:hypothetical protein
MRSLLYSSSQSLSPRSLPSTQCSSPLTLPQNPISLLHHVPRLQETEDPRSPSHHQQSNDRPRSFINDIHPSDQSIQTRAFFRSTTPSHSRSINQPQLFRSTTAISPLPPPSHYQPATTLSPSHSRSINQPSRSPHSHRHYQPTTALSLSHSRSINTTAVQTTCSSLNQISTPSKSRPIIQ